MIEITLSTGELVHFSKASARKLRGTRLPGSELIHAEREGYDISVQQIKFSLYQLSYRDLKFSKAVQLHRREKVKGLRLEAVLTGHLPITDSEGNALFLLPGQYHITDSSFIKSEFLSNSGCTYLTIYYSKALLDYIGQGASIQVMGPRVMPTDMIELINEILDNPYNEDLLPFFYENCIRDILFIHRSAPEFIIPGDLTANEIAAVYEADRIISENLNAHFTIKELARKAGTNAFSLKKGFKYIYGCGAFNRLIYLRMERAKYLLQKTDMPIKDIFYASGYDTASGFVTAFKKRFNITPKDWRKKNRG